MTSPWYVYAIVGRDTPLPAAIAGDGIAELALVPCRGLAAVTGRMTQDGAGAVTVDAVLRHEAVVEAVRHGGPALPVRFGTTFDDEASLGAALAERYDSLVADLDRLGDKLEMGITALWSAPPSGDAMPAAPRADGAGDERGAGARYLFARAAETRRGDALRERARAVARELDLAVGRHALERRVTLLPTPRVAVRAAYLLDPAGVDAFRAAFEAARGTREELRVLLTGPWPPYSFVGRAESDGGAAGGGRVATLARLLTDALRVRPD